MSKTPSTFSDNLFAGGGEMGSRMSEIDWRQTPLGTQESWPPSLCVTLKMVLTSSCPMFMTWGQDYLYFYNDAYRLTFGLNAEGVTVGQPLKDSGLNAWERMGSDLQAVLKDAEAIQRQEMYRFEAPNPRQERYFNQSYSPIWDETHQIAGVLSIVTDITQQVIHARRLQTLQELSDRIPTLSNFEQTCSLLLDTLTTNPQDIPFALLYGLNEQQESKGAECGVRSAKFKLLSILNTPVSPYTTPDWLLSRVLETNQPQKIDWPSVPDPLSNLTEEAFVLPIHRSVSAIAGLLVLGINPYLTFDDDYQSFFKLVVTQIEATLAQVWAENARQQRDETLAKLEHTQRIYFQDLAQWKSTETALKQSESRLRLAQKAASAGVWDWDIVSNTVTWSEEYYLLYGIDPKTWQPSYENWLRCVHPEDRDYCRQATIKALEEQTELDLEFRILHPAGVRWVHVLGQVFYNSFQQPLRMVGIALDITRRKQVEEALKASEARFRRLFECNTVAIGVWTADGRIIDANDALLNLIGYTWEELKGGLMNWQNITPPEYRYLDEQALAEIYTRGYSSPLEKEYIHKQGYRIPVLVGGATFLDQLDTGIFFIVDLTTQKRSERELRQSEERLRVALKNSPIMVFNQDTDLRYTWIFNSPQPAYPPDYEMIGKLETDLFDPEDAEKVSQIKRQVLETEIGLREEVQVTMRGEEFYFDLTVEPLFNGNDDVVGITCAAINISALKKVEIALRKSETILNAMLASSPIGIAFLDRDLNYIQINEALAAVNGLPRSQHLGNSLGQVLPQFATQVMPIFKQVMETQQPLLNQEVVSFNSQGEYRHSLVNYYPVCLSDGEVLGVGITNMDMTELKKAEQALRESEARFRGVVESNMVGILFWDGEGYLIDGNRKAVEMLGYSQEELQGRQVQWKKITPREYWDLDGEMLEVILKSGTCPPFEKEYIRKDGVQVPVLLGCALLPGYRDRGVAYMLDISDRKRSEARERLLAAASSVLVSSLDSKTTLTSLAALVVPSLADFCFFDILTTPETLERVVWLHKDPTRQDWFSQVKTCIPPMSGNHPITRVLATGRGVLIPEITEGWIQGISSTPEQMLFLRDCQPYSMITVPLIARTRKLGVLTLCLTRSGGRCYTKADQRLAEELAYRAALAVDNAQLYYQAQEANRIKDEFLAVLSHELRTPLNPIVGWAKLLRSRQFDPQTTERALETIERNAKLQVQLIEDLLDVSRILRGKMILNVTSVNLNQTIEAALETVHLAAEAKNISIEWIHSSDPIQVAGDASRLQQIVWNLLSNAVKFTPSGGWVKIRLNQIGTYAQIQVEDNGKGITPEFLPFVFEYFRQADGTTTRQFGGLGLGLAIVRHLCELHGGRVMAQSRGEGFGATFTVQIPLLMTVSPTTIPGQSSLETGNLVGLRILAVDDQADTQELLMTLLEQYGAEVKCAACATEALRLFEEFQPDLLVSDISMPEVDGYMLLQEIRQRSPEQGGKIPAIALTAYAGELNQKRAIEAGFQKHLPKPVEPEMLVQAILNLMGK